MKKEINIFTTKDIASFGGKTLVENLKDAELAIADLGGDFRIHNHSNTQFSWQRFVLSHKGGLRNLRQITAEINKKKLALHEAKYKYKKDIIKRLSLIDKINSQNEMEKFKRLLIEVKIKELEEKLELSLSPIEGAIKDILTLKAAYDEIIKQYPNYTEADLEREEAAYWIRRIFSQSLRDVRQWGFIMSGNQEAIEQLGLNVSYVSGELKEYLKKEQEIEDSSGKTLENYLEFCVNKYTPNVINAYGYGSFSGKICERSLYEEVQDISTD